MGWHRDVVFAAGAGRAMTLGQRFADVCALWALEEGGLTFIEPERAMRFVLDNWNELHEACEIADGVKGKVATEPIVAAMVDALVAAGEMRALGDEDEEQMAQRFAVLMLKQAKFSFPKDLH
jgi:hypothetical protein